MQQVDALEKIYKWSIAVLDHYKDKELTEGDWASIIDTIEKNRKNYQSYEKLYDRLMHYLCDTLCEMQKEMKKEKVV